MNVMKIQSSNIKKFKFQKSVRICKIKNFEFKKAVSEEKQNFIRKPNLTNL